MLVLHVGETMRSTGPTGGGKQHANMKRGDAHTWHMSQILQHTSLTSRYVVKIPSMPKRKKNVEKAERLTSQNCLLLKNLSLVSHLCSST